MKSSPKIHYSLSLLLLTILVGGLAFAQSGSWTTKAPMLDIRVGVASGVINSKLYLAGGSPSTPTLEIYDSASNTWSIGSATMANSRCAASAGVINNRLYVAEGWLGCNSGSSTTALEIYDPTTNSWVTAAPSLVPRGNAASAVIGGRLYIAGGASNSYATVFNQLEIYDPGTGTWSLGAPIPIGLPGQAGAAIDGKFYVVGGYSPSSGTTSNGLWIYDPATNTWTAGPPMPTGRSELFAGVIDGKLYAVAGYTGAVNTGIVEVYDPVSNSWTTGVSAPTARSWLNGGVLNSKLYITAGYDGATFFTSLEVFTPTSTPSPSPTPPPDTTQPTLVLPSNITADATGPAGAFVNYSVSATDDSDLNPNVLCSPLSGNTFAIGTTTVHCTATDSSNNSSQGSFTITVSGADTQTANLITLVQSFNLARGITNSLDSKLQNVLDAFNAANAGDRANACNQLAAFINNVRAQSGNQLTVAQANQLIAKANQIRAVEGCQ